MASLRIPPTLRVIAILPLLALDLHRFVEFWPHVC
jgi:hypothetical protein